MNLSRGWLVALGVLVAGCGPSYNHNRGGGYPNGYQGGYANAYPSRYGSAPPPPWGLPAPPPYQGPSWGPPELILPPIRPVNVGALLDWRVQSLPCAPHEEAPGVWVRFDCGFTPISKVLPLIVPMIRPMNGTTLGFDGELPGGLTPPSVDLRAIGLDGPIKNQGAVGACTAFSLSTAMDIGARKLGHQDVMSALHVWSNYGVPNIGVAGDQSVNKSIATESTWPYDPAKACKFEQDNGDACGQAYGVMPGTASADPILTNEKSNADGAGRYKVTSIEQFQSPVSPDTVATVLASGDPVWVSMTVNSNAWSQRSLQNGVIPDYVADTDEGHAVVLIGYRPGTNGRQFLLHNSWGRTWGEGGYGWISEAMIRQYTRVAYKVRIAESNGVGPVVPPTIPVGPGPAVPADGNCPAGQRRDTLLGNCAAACSDGSAQNAGICLNGGKPGGSPIPGLPIPGGFPIPGGLPSIPGFPQVNPGPSQPKQPNQPSQSPTSSCGQGQATDPVTGKCANLCASGLPPVGGMCVPGLPKIK